MLKTINNLLGWIFPLSKDLKSTEKSPSQNKQVDGENKPEFLDIPAYHLYTLEYQNQKQSFDDILRNQRTAIRQDYTVYRFNFTSCCQAIAFVVGFFMLINLILYLVRTYGPNSLSGYPYILSMIMFAESGFLLIASGLTIHRRELVLKKRQKYGGKYNPNAENLKFAFAHSFTYFVAAICIASISYFVYYLY